MTTEYASRKNEECYDHVFILHHPDEEREACRPLRTAPAYDRQKDLGAQIGQVNGWERPNYYGPKDAPADFDHNSRSFRRGAWWQYAKAEAEAVRNTVGIIDASAFTKHLVRGPGATAFLDHFTCNKLPNVGRINLTYALTDHGTTRTEYTIVRLKQDEYYLISAGAWTAYDYDFLQKAADDWMAAGKGPSTSTTSPPNGASSRWPVPNARALLKDIVKDADPDTVLGNKRFPWLSTATSNWACARSAPSASPIPASLAGNCTTRSNSAATSGICSESPGEKHGLKGVGARAQNWLRQEKSYRAFGNELGRDATPLEAALDRFVDLTKDFQGKKRCSPPASARNA
jgi:dimethylglycine dehydrogenase